MTDERIIDLINAGIDGELNKSEQSELRQALDQSSEARSLQTGLRKLAATISDLPQQEPPDNLRQQILNKIQLPALRKQTSRLWELRAFAGYGIAIAAGLMMIVGIYQFGPRNSTPEEISDMTGTISKQDPAAQLLILDKFSLDLDTVSGDVSLQSRGDSFIVDFDLKTNTMVNVLVEYAGEGLQFSSLEQIDGGLATAELSEGSVRLSTTGNQQFSVYLVSSGDSSADKHVRLTTEFFSQGEQVHERVLESPR